MKYSILLSLLLLCSTLFSQTEKYTDVYSIHYDVNEEGTLDYMLDIEVDGTFTFHIYRKISYKNPEENFYGKGTWKVEKENVIYFYADIESDIDEKYTLDFNNTKARYITKSPRDKSDKEVKTHLRFYESETSWLKGRKLFKN